MKQFCLAIALGLAALPAAAATLDDLTTARAERDAVWEEVPFGARVAVFAEASAAGFGDYTPRASNVFKQTDPFFLYVEPVGYGFPELDAAARSRASAPTSSSRMPTATSWSTRRMRWR